MLPEPVAHEQERIITLADGQEGWTFAAQRRLAAEQDRQQAEIERLKRLLVERDEVLAERDRMIALHQETVSQAARGNHRLREALAKAEARVVELEAQHSSNDAATKVRAEPVAKSTSYQPIKWVNVRGVGSADLQLPDKSLNPNLCSLRCRTVRFYIP